MLLDDAALARVLDRVPTAWDDVPGLRAAAVLAPIFRRGGEDWLLFTERRSDLAHHAGQISFPGGGRNEGEDPLACALRETEEEIGQAPGEVVVLGGLATRTSTSAYRVHTLVGRIPAPSGLSLDAREVQSILEVPLGDLLDEGRWEEREFVSGDKRYRPTPHFEHEGHTIWGLTGRLTVDLLELIRRAPAH